ncbi:MAG: hypothetical protein JO101_05720 [Candidatus Eremiobacteraeota bacterium]|nr:hypothetical protein [Candidatus Eremiobacteraeota bacterium]
MNRDDRPSELRTEADDEEPLDTSEAAVMGRQAVHRLRDIAKNQMTVYGEVDQGFENEDQADAHRAQPGEHL